MGQGNTPEGPAPTLRRDPQGHEGQGCRKHVVPGYLTLPGTPGNPRGGSGGIRSATWSPGAWCAGHCWSVLSAANPEESPRVPAPDLGCWSCPPPPPRPPLASRCPNTPCALLGVPPPPAPRPGCPSDHPAEDRKRPSRLALPRAPFGPQMLGEAFIKHSFDLLSASPSPRE